MKPLTCSQKRNREAAILKAAAAVLTSRGLPGLTMERVAGEAGLAKGTLFLYYGDKRTLLLALFSSMADELGASLKKLAASPADPETLIRETVSVLLRHFDRKRDMTGYSGGLPFAGADRERLRSRFSSNITNLAGILNTCSKAGFLKAKNPLFAASALFGLCRGSNSYARMEGRNLPLTERTKLITHIFLNGTRKKQ